MSRPIVVIVCMNGPFESWGTLTAPTFMALTCRKTSRLQQQKRRHRLWPLNPVANALISKMVTDFGCRLSWGIDRILLCLVVLRRSQDHIYLTFSCTKSISLKVPWLSRADGDLGSRSDPSNGEKLSGSGSFADADCPSPVFSSISAESSISLIELADRNWIRCRFLRRSNFFGLG